MYRATSSASCLPNNILIALCKDAWYCPIWAVDHPWGLPTALPSDVMHRAMLIYVNPWSPFYYHVLTLNPSWINNHMPIIVWENELPVYSSGIISGSGKPQLWMDQNNTFQELLFKLSFNKSHYYFIYTTEYRMWLVLIMKLGRFGMACDIIPLDGYRSGNNTVNQRSSWE